MEPFATAPSGSEAFLEGGGVALGLGIFLARLIHCGVGQAHHHPSDRSQGPRRVGSAHSALIFMESDVQTMVQSAFNDPVAALESEHPLGLQLVEGQTAQKINHLAVPFVITLDPALQAGGQPGSRKPRLTGRDLQALQEANLQPAPVVLPLHHAGSRRGDRGEKPVL